MLYHLLPWNTKGQSWFCEWHMCLSEGVGKLHWRKNTLPPQITNKSHYHKVVGCQFRIRHKASADCREVQALRAPSGFLSYFTVSCLPIGALHWIKIMGETSVNGIWARVVKKNVLTELINLVLSSIWKPQKAILEGSLSYSKKKCSFLIFHLGGFFLSNKIIKALFFPRKRMFSIYQLY